MNRKALLLATALGLSSAASLTVYQRRFEERVSGGAKVKVVTVVKPVSAGKAIAEDAITVREVPAAYVEERAIREAEMARVVGLEAGLALSAGQTLLWTDLAAAGDERRDLSSLVIPGYRATTLRAERGDATALVRAGDYVDVIGLDGAAGDGRTATLLLQRALVLASGLDMGTGAPGDRAARADRGELTLSLTVAESQLVALAQERGALTVSVRHPDDLQRVTSPASLSLAQALATTPGSLVDGLKSRPLRVTPEAVTR